MTPAQAILRRVALRTATVLCGLVPTVVAVSAVDRGGDFWPPGSVALLAGPVCLAMGSAWAAGELRAEGAWGAALRLGHPPLRLWRTTLVVAVLVGLASLGGRGPAPQVGIAQVAPIPAAASVWWDGSAWTEPAAEHQVVPAAMSTRALVARSRAVAPPGARRGVDGAELIRRLGWAGAYPLAALAGAAAALAGRPRRRRRTTVGTAAVVATAGTATFLIGVVALSAYAASIT